MPCLHELTRIIPRYESTQSSRSMPTEYISLSDNSTNSGLLITRTWLITRAPASAVGVRAAAHLLLFAEESSQRRLEATFLSYDMFVERVLAAVGRRHRGRRRMRAVAERLPVGTAIVSRSSQRWTEDSADSYNQPPVIN